jgi:NIPSNAP
VKLLAYLVAMLAREDARIAAMKRRSLLQSLPAITLLPAATWAASAESQPKADPASTTIYELRVYHTLEGKLPDLLKRFREHTTKLFEKHGLKNVAYWTPVDEPAKSNTLIYVLAHPSREAAAANWKAFQDDPDWKAVRDKSEENGKIVEKVDSTYMQLTDFSPAK